FPTRRSSDLQSKSQAALMGSGKCKGRSETRHILNMKSGCSGRNRRIIKRDILKNQSTAPGRRYSGAKDRSRSRTTRRWICKNRRQKPLWLLPSVLYLIICRDIKQTAEAKMASAVCFYISTVGSHYGFCRLFYISSSAEASERSSL